MDILIQGILLGGLYCAVSLGLSLVFGVLGLVNLAHGQVLVCGTMLLSVTLSWIGGDPLLVGLGLALVLGAAGYALQALVFSPVLRKSAEATIPATFGTGVALQSVLLLWLGSDPREINAPYATASFSVIGVSVRWSLVIALLAAAVMTAGLHWMLTRTRFGAEVSASAADPASAEIVGIDVASRYAWVFAIAVAISSYAGTLVGLSFAMDPVSGSGWLVRAFTVVVLGGLGSVPGTMAGALIVGIAEALGAQLFGPQYRDVVVFGLLVAVLLIRPQGLSSLAPALRRIPRLRRRPWPAEAA